MPYPLTGMSKLWALTDCNGWRSADKKQRNTTVRMGFLLNKQADDAVIILPHD
jgi:hypothetical protein